MQLTFLWERRIFAAFDGVLTKQSDLGKTSGTPRPRLSAEAGVSASSGRIPVTVYLQVGVGGGSGGGVRSLLFTPIVWAGTGAAHCGGSRSSGGSRLPLSNYCRDRKVSRRAIPSWERWASRLRQHTHTHAHKPVISALGACPCGDLFM